MKVTLLSDGSVAFDVATAAEAIELARALQNGQAHSGEPVQAVANEAACIKEEAVLVEAESDVDDDAEVAAAAVAHDKAVVEKRPSDIAVLVDVSTGLADYFESQNERFKREQFLAACGLDMEAADQ